ncbi:MAG: hypothetical protein JNL12_10645 [Planctomycetes bacterium]|nr:hypothetical protein [Planctomycetota bacterium]
MNGLSAAVRSTRTRVVAVAPWLATVLLVGCSAAPEATRDGPGPSADPALPAAAAKAGVFAPFLGSFRGELRMLTAQGEQRVPMGLDVLPTDDPAVWTWTLRYGSGEREQVRDYRLRLDHVEFGLCRIDERNGVELTGHVDAGELTTVFEVPEQTLVVRYRAVAGGLEFSLLAWHPDAGVPTGSGVRTIREVSAQRAVLRAVGR